MTTAVAAPTARGVVNPHAGSASLPVQVLVLARRSIKGALSRPQGYMPAVIMPLLLLTINSSGLSDATRIPGFPADRFLDFLLVITFMQAALFATSNAGLGLARDIEEGFMDRLALTPMRTGALVTAQISGAVVIAFGAAIVYIIIGLATQVDFHSGVLGVLLLLVLATWTAFCFAAIGAWLALRSGSSEALQGIFPLLFASLFLSTLNMPRDLIEAEWFQVVTRFNPVSYMVDGMRSLIITGWDGRALLEMVAVLALVSGIGIAGCARALRRRQAQG
ncbi:MAG: transporter permease [Thermoleophilia bacterium]|nr:transporter permease [Thermoleophilia bacterium]MCZ4495468.1 transporter permease [Thermoleophilia bacterium]